MELTPGEVVFLNHSLHATSYHWDFGDGNISKVSSPTHVYKENGTYRVALTVFNDVGIHTPLDNVTIENYQTHETGKLIFWTAKQEISVSKKINIQVDGGNAGEISRYSTNVLTPNCGEFGYITIERTPGTYNYTASDGTNNWNGTITIEAVKCKNEQLM